MTFLVINLFSLPKISPFLLQLHTVAQNERQIKSKTKQNLELNAKNKELTQLQNGSNFIVSMLLECQIKQL